MNQSMRLIIIAGGTGGHVFPGIEIANYLINKGWQVRWLGTKDRIEADIVPKHGIKIDFIHISSFRNKNAKALMLLPLNVFNAWRQARAIMKSFKPNVVLGMGGYVSGPGVLAAWSLKIPIVIHEQNCIAGLTNKLLAKIASKVIQAFPGAFPDAEVVGNPIRANMLYLPKPEVRLEGREGPLRVLVVGGSQGALVFNQIMPQVAAKLGSAITVLHQSGKGLQQVVERAYSDFGKMQYESYEYKVTEFIEDMVSAYNWADVLVCRAGALTVSEVTAIGLPAIFVPFKHKDRQQYWNALPLEKAGAAKIFEQPQFTVNIVVNTLASLNRETLLKMAKRARSIAIAIPNSTKRIAQEINSVAKI